jgi:hypothetical protein
VLCQVYFCDLSALDHSIEGVAFSQNRCLFVGAARSRTLSIAPGDQGCAATVSLACARFAAVRAQAVNDLLAKQSQFYATLATGYLQ